MFNPILSEVVAREQRNDLIREAEHHRLIKTLDARQSTDRIDLRAALSNFALLVRYRFRTLAHIER